MKLRVLLASLMLATTISAKAIPLTYDVTFAGGFGSGAFAYDAEIPSLFDLTISFAALPSGPLNLRLISANSAASFLFEILTGEDVDEAQCSEEGEACRFSTSDIDFGFEASFSRSGAITEFALLDPQGEQVFSGGFVARQRRVDVAEPGALALVGLGLLVFGLGVRRRKDLQP